MHAVGVNMYTSKNNNNIMTGDDKNSEDMHVLYKRQV